MKAIWQTKTIGEILQKTETVNPQQTPDSEFDYIDVSSISNTTFQIESTQHLKGVDAPSRARKLVRTNDILFATIRPTLQRIAIVPEHLNGQVCSTGYFVLRPKPEIDYRFLFYFLFSQDFSGQMEVLQKGASYPAVTDGDVKGQVISFPPLPEQHRIVAILDEAFDGIASTKANAEKNLQNARAIFESHLQSVFSQDAKEWMARKLGDTSILKIIDGDRGSNYPSKEDFSDDGFCLFLNTKNVRPDGFNFDTTMFISEEKDKALRKGKLQRFDVILTTRGTIGNVAIYDEDVDFENIRINSGMLIFRPNTEALLPSFLFEVFRSGIMRSQMAMHVSGAAQPQLPIKTLINFEIPIPKTLEAQRGIVLSVREVDTETQRLESIYQQKIAALDALKKSLLHQAFNGQL